MRLMLSLFALVFVPSLAAAQSHPCDVASPASVQTKSPPTAFGVCWDGKDVEGNAATLTALKVFIDGAQVKSDPAPSVSATANAAGLRYYSTSGVAVSKGSRSLTVVITTADGDSDPSAAYPFSVVGGKPSRPVGARVEPR